MSVSFLICADVIHYFSAELHNYVCCIIFFLVSSLPDIWRTNRYITINVRLLIGVLVCRSMLSFIVVNESGFLLDS